MSHGRKRRKEKEKVESRNWEIADSEISAFHFLLSTFPFCFLFSALSFGVDDRVVQLRQEPVDGRQASGPGPMPAIVLAVAGIHLLSPIRSAPTV
jgi:hypothetical protein